VVGVAKYLPAHAGLNLLMEVKNLSVIQKNPKRPLVVIIGGAKISTKTPVIKQYLPKAKHVLLGGGVVTNLLRASGCKVGSSMVDEAGVRAAKQLLKYFGKKICKPVDLVIGDTKTFRKVKTVNIDEACSVLCQKGRAIYDIGPETVKEYKKRLQGAKTIIWNGPLGLVEVLAFSRATNEIALAMARSRAKTYVGGGETLMVVNRLGLTQKFTFVSTGGGAMLKFLEGKKLPGLKILLKK
ncbi:phosphoglycerate kinase, partial [Candidatus Saccharibacteria bacterium]|nr:phosphoglycerate kinase [Candidatus Saccharibacteria bacterium]NIV03266.1 phosphoglycerate kinase [Calditrichia bacterium]NIS37785.1 phosphoglycerate kinase [Candidatus Saccharibacteria bacterium]NIV71424.1 phosphoglycerate kinase [Calditrichia bacterium]NIV97944.1 phosphoglycerate kinase [Candidatus Saccharibacteria bacterium]